jgi:ADP-ribose pyrophosphatase YjhB (NUDIX family)
MKSFICSKGCCKYSVAPYNYNHPQDYYNRREKTLKAGIFITNNSFTKVLLVQSRQKLWGPPKGSLYPNESVQEGAVREVKEETGLEFDPKDLEDPKLIKGRSHYYHKQINEVDLLVQTTEEGNDANGIGWFSIDCIDEMILNGTIKINQHCRLLFRKILSIILPQNQKDRMLKAF